jgi:hypothetical protein
MLHVVTQLIPERLQNDSEGLPAIVVLQVFYILQQENIWLSAVYDASDVEEQGSLRLVFETVRATQSSLLGYSGQREWLTGKACEQHFVIRNSAYFHIPNISRNRVLQTEIGFISHASELVQFARKYTLSPDCLESDAKSSDAREKVNESKRSPCSFTENRGVQRCAFHFRQ